MELNWIKFPASQINTSIQRRSLNTFPINFISQKGYKKYDYPKWKKKEKKNIGNSASNTRNKYKISLF